MSASQKPANNLNKVSQWFSAISLRSRLIIGSMIITGLAVLILGFFTFRTRRQATDYISNLLANETTRQSEQQLLDLVRIKARESDQFFVSVADDVVVTANYVTELFAQEAILGRGDYWDAQEKMIQLSENQWGNPVTDNSSVLAPSTVTFNNDVVSDINTIVHLDFLVPQLLEANPNILALFFIHDKTGTTTYFPNIDLANVAGDFDARERPYYQAVAPETMSEVSQYWSTLYVDAALNGIVQTSSYPVYDEAGEFLGVVGADLLITTIVDVVENIQVGETGFGFLIDSEGRFVALPQAGLRHFDLQAGDLPENDIPTKTVADAPTEIQEFTDKMMAGESGLGTLSTGEADFYLAYSPLMSAEYSLGIIVPVEEMIQLYLTVNERMIGERNDSLRVTLIISFLVLAASVLFSYSFGRVLIRPLDELTKAVEDAAGGNFDIVIESDVGGEIGALATAFNNMTSQIKELISNLEIRVADRTRALETSLDVSRSLSTIMDSQQLMFEVVNQIRAAFDYYHAHIYLLDEETNDLIMAGGTGVAGMRMLENGHKIPAGKGLVGRAATTKNVVLIPDVTKERGWLSNPLLPDTKSEVAVPILTGGRLLGVLDVQQNTVGGLTTDDARLLQSVANQVAVALGNARLFEQAQEQADREATIIAINQKIQSARNIESILQTAVREIGTALETKRISVQLGSPSRTTNGAEYGEEGAG